MSKLLFPLKIIWQFTATIYAYIYVNIKFKNIKAVSKKNIVFLVPWLAMGGAEKVNLEIIEALKLDGWNIFIITTKENKHDWKSKFAIVSSQIIHLESFPAKLHTYIISSAIKKLSITLAFISNSVSGYIASPHISKLCSVIDLTHSEGGLEDNGGAPAFAAQFDIFLNKRIVISDRLKKLYIEKYHINSEKIVVIRNGVDRNEILDDIKKVVLDHNIELFLKRKKIIIWVGRFSSEKQPLLVIEIAKKMVEYNFLMIGDGELYKEALAKANDLQNIYIPGALSNVMLKKALSLSDVLILTSKFEGVPMVILEAMALGVPVVSVDVGAINEIIDNNVDGYIVSNILLKMPEKLEEAYRNKATLGSKSIDKITSQFTKTKMQDEYKKVFKEILNIT